MNGTNEQQPSAPPPSNPFDFMMQQLLELQATMPWREGFYGMPFCAGPIYQGMGQQLENQHQYQAAIQAPSSGSSGPSRSQRKKGPRKAKAPYHYNKSHESSGTIAGDRSTGTHPGHARIGASDNTGAGKVWRTPPLTHPLMTDHKLNPSRSERNPTKGFGLGGVTVGVTRAVPTRWTPPYSRFPSSMN
jgi:hypothetical protein